MHNQFIEKVISDYIYMYVYTFICVIFIFHCVFENHEHGNDCLKGL